MTEQHTMHEHPSTNHSAHDHDGHEAHGHGDHEGHDRPSSGANSG